MKDQDYLYQIRNKYDNEEGGNNIYLVVRVAEKKRWRGSEAPSLKCKATP